MSGNRVARRTGGLWWSVGVVAAGILFLASFANAETIGNNLWNLRENTEYFFDNNDSWVRPWRTTVDDGYGMFQGGHQFYFPWLTDSTSGNPADGSLSIDRGVNHQFDAWTFLYVATPTTISLIGQGECVPRWFLNYQFDSPHEFPLGSPASISLSAGWNRLDITGYNQNTDFLFESGALVGQVAIMNTSPVPEPSTFAMVVVVVGPGGLVLLTRRRIAWRTRLRTFAARGS